MPLVTTANLITAARVKGGAVGAFNVITLEHVEAVVLGAESVGVPVIIQVSENAVRFHTGQLNPLARAAAAAAELSTVPVALHLDHVTQLALLHQAFDGGFSSAMFDAGAAPYDQNVAATRAAVDWAHGNDMWLEAELGYVGGKPDAPISAHTPGTRTDPREAAEFVKETGVDALAVAVGSSHAMTTRTATLDHVLIRQLAAAVTVPLVLHGSSGVTEPDLAGAVAAGISKVNVGTALNVAYTRVIRQFLDSDAHVVDPRKYLNDARGAAAEVVATVLRLITG